jgi:filamentous hemagglutinin family protein
VNLFHSFGEFGVPNNNIANFLNDSGLATSNILGRVTGGSISNIFGAIQTQGFGSANLFLMNPAGFLFGPNATVNVGGMVSFTSADYLRLTDGARFNVIPNAAADALLTTAPVAAYGFLGSNAGAITIQGSQLSVTPGQSLSLVGGNITVQSGVLDDGITSQSARLSVPGGQINLASVTSPGEILLPNTQFAPNSTGQSFTTMGSISIAQGSLIEVSADNAGTIQIRGGQLVISDSTIAANTINSNGAPLAVDIQVSGDLSLVDTTGVTSISAQTSGSGNAGEVNISSANTTATSSTFGFPGVVMIDTHTSGSGKGGNVSITTGNLDASSSLVELGISVFIDSGFTANGQGGNVSIRANRFNSSGQIITTGDFMAIQINDFDHAGSAGNVAIAAEDIQQRGGSIVADAGNAGTGGNISLQAKNMLLELTNVTTFGFEQGGFLNIQAESLHSIRTLIESSSFNGQGPITITGNALEFTQGSRITAQTGGDGNAGPINITANDHLTLSGTDQGPLAPVGLPTGIFTNSFGFLGPNGNAGTVRINTPSLTITDGARINTLTAANGRGGDVIINAQSVNLSGEFPGFIPEDTFDLGNIHAGGISTKTVGGSCMGPCGNAGNVTITTNTLNIANGSQINSGTASEGNGGLITINAKDTVSISGRLTDGSPGGIISETVASTPGSGVGGNIAITAGQTVTITEGASISASTSGPGHAGNILVKANDIKLGGGGTITAVSTGPGNAGTVTVQGLNSPANSFLIDGAGSGVFTTTSDTGTGGDISIDANAVSLQNGAHLSSNSAGSGSTGNIQINAGNQLAMNGSSVTTEANQASGGAIKITTTPSGTVELTDSTITASVLDGTGGGGSVDIDPQFVILQNSQILADAVFGPGGNINITTNLLLPDTTSVIRASSQFGQQGNIVIQSPVSPASGKIIPLGQKPLIATALVSQRCAALAGGNASSFTVAGRDSLPAEPSGWVSSPLALASSEVGDAMEPTSRTSRSEPIEEMPLLSLRRIAPPGFLTQNFDADGTTGCTS